MAFAALMLIEYRTVRSRHKRQKIKRSYKYDTVGNTPDYCYLIYLKSKFHMPFSRYQLPNHKNKGLDDTYSETNASHCDIIIRSEIYKNFSHLFITITIFLID